ncbi:uncharacterized protein VTP21DRAFT_6506 [Calcarisporiella thermophila]|uniref:uncharacterized protein n=1 Tax=Calcarisporiella thermophila TaxID=911321 RepID=UPI0037427424
MCFACSPPDRGRSSAPAARFDLHGASARSSPVHPPLSSGDCLFRIDFRLGYTLFPFWNLYQALLGTSEAQQLWL